MRWFEVSAAIDRIAIVIAGVSMVGLVLFVFWQKVLP